MTLCSSQGRQRTLRFALLRDGGKKLSEERWTRLDE